MIVVHHLEQSRSQRLVWLLEELQVPYELVVHHRNPGTRAAPPALRAIHPLGKSPIIEDEGRVLAETAAIFAYLCDRYDTDRQFSPSAERLDDNALGWRHWLHYAEGSAMAVLAMKLLLSGVEGDGAERTAQNFVDPQVQLHADFWESSLAPTGWLAGGAFSAADVIMSFPIQAALGRFGALLGERPVLTDYLAVLKARPAYRRAVARGT